MAPISSLSSLSTTSSTVNACHCGSSADNLWNVYLPISRRGLFLQDSFFEHAHALFNDAVRQVLGRWGESDSLLTDRCNDTNFSLSNNLSRYRQLRAHNLKEENQAVTTSDDTTSHKIVLDVHDFLEGEVKVKVVGERQLVVEGQTKTNSGDHTVSSQTFRRTFTLPDLTNMEAITSVMSSDGVLTITAPKIVTQANKECLMIPITVEGTTSTIQAENSSSSSSQTTSNKEECRRKVGSQGHDSSSSQTTSNKEECRRKVGSQGHEAVNGTVHHQNVRKLPMKINSIVIGSNCDSQASESEPSCVHSDGSKTNSKLESESQTVNLVTREADDRVTKTTDKSKEKLLGNFAQVKNTSSPSTNTSVTSDGRHSKMEQVQTNSKLQTQNSSPSKVQEVRNIPVSNYGFLPIARRGLFSSDSFFEDIRKDFENTVNETLRKWGETGPLAEGWGDASLRLSNNLGRYRQLRIHNLREEDQAVTVTSDKTSHKIVLDVHDFLEGEVKVKVVRERQLVVEGQTKTNSGDHTVSSQTFRRTFTLPDLTNMETITSVMSSDGVLTITASLKVSQGADEGHIIPINVQGRSNAEAKCPSTLSSPAASGNSTSTTNSKIIEAKQTNRTVGQCHEKMQQQNTTKPTLHECRTESKTEDKVTRNNESLKKVPQQFREEGVVVASQEHWKKGKTIAIKIDTDVSEAAEPIITPEETGKPSHQSVTTSEKSSVISQCENCVGKQTAADSSGVHSLRSTILPVTTRGLFFGDSFFQNAWNDFQDAVRDVVSKWGDRSSTTDDMTCYRTLRSRDNKEEYQAAKSSEDELNIKIVVDVRNFTNGGEITVKAVRERELMVEGRLEKEEDGSLFTKRFLRHFLLPCDVCLESVSSVLSSDGVLTITAPKKPSTLRIKEVIVPTSVEEGRHKTESVKVSSDQTLKLNTETQTRSVSPAVPVKGEGSSPAAAAAVASVTEQSSPRHSSSLTSPKVGDTRENIIPVQVDETQESQTSVKENFLTKNTNSKKTHRKDDFWITKPDQEDNEVEDSTSGKTTAVDLHLQQDDINHQVTTQGTHSTTNGSTDVNTNESASRMDQHSRTNIQNVNSVSQNKWLPITMKGTFFNDSFFEDSRKNFAAAVRDVLKTKEGSSLSDDITAYRSLRQQDLKLENQAVRVEENQRSLKIVMDVYDFIGGDVKVSVAGGKELVVEGRANVQEGTSKATRTFLRRFSLPRYVQLDAITSAMSSDGVLTIISPKVQQASQTGASDEEMFSESQSRIDAHSDIGRAWAEKSQRKSTKDSEGCSSCRALSSTYRSHQEYSSKKYL